MNDNYIYIYPFCFITKGRHFFSIYDTLHKRMHKFDIELYDIAKTQFRKRTVGELLSLYNINDKEVILSFIEYLINNDLARYVNNIDCFPLLKEQWDSPFTIKRCIIDIRNIWHNLDSIFLQLSKLLCPKVEIRVYRALQLNEIKEIIKVFHNYDFGVLFLVFPYNELLLTEEGSMQLSREIQNDYRIMLNMYGVPDDMLDVINNIKETYTSLSYSLTTSPKNITGKEDCGEINPTNFHEMSIEEIMENRCYNGCLNRVISIDEEGQIKNCPSMAISYGHISTDSLLNICAKDDFKKYWGLCNSMIEECKECEMRIICLGCRAYLSDPSNIYSKPRKCNYIP